jgi:hypothetical protein
MNRRSCSQCGRSLEDGRVLDSPAAETQASGPGYRPEAYAILGGSFLGALLCAAVWLLFLYEPVIRWIGGPHYYFNDFLMYVAPPLSALLAMIPGIFFGAAAADFRYRRHEYWRYTGRVNWGAAATAALAFLGGLLLAIAAFFYISFVALLLPVAALLIAVFVYLARTTPRLDGRKGRLPHHSVA